MSKKEIEELVDKLIKEKHKIKKVSGLFSEMTFYAFRYCLGRMTFAPSTCSEYVKTNINLIHNNEVQLMIKEISEYAEKGFLGHKCDIATWTDLQHFLKKERDKRNDNIK